MDNPAANAHELPPFNSNVASPARMWNYWIGGKDNFESDRTAAEAAIEALPSLPVTAKLVRLFLASVVHRLVAEFGVRQFLDIGAGLPTADNTHEVAQRAAPESRIVYVDHDPVVISHARALLTSSKEGKTDFLHADLRDVEQIVADASQTLDLGQPVAVLLIGVLHFVPDDDDPYGVVARLMNAMAPGSYLVLVHAASDIASDAVAEAARRYNQRSTIGISLRDRDQIAGFFTGLDLVEPGLVPLSQWWKPGEADTAGAGALTGHCAVARKP